MRLTTPSTVDGAIRALDQALTDLDRIVSIKTVAAQAHYEFYEAFDAESKRGARIAAKLRDLLE